MKISIYNTKIVRTGLRISLKFFKKLNEVIKCMTIISYIYTPCHFFFFFNFSYLFGDVHYQYTYMSFSQSIVPDVPMNHAVKVNETLPGPFSPLKITLIREICFQNPFTKTFFCKTFQLILTDILI